MHVGTPLTEELDYVELAKLDGNVQRPVPFQGRHLRVSLCVEQRLDRTHVTTLARHPQRRHARGRVLEVGIDALLEQLDDLLRVAALRSCAEPIALEQRRAARSEPRPRHLHPFRVARDRVGEQVARQLIRRAQVARHQVLQGPGLACMLRHLRLGHLHIHPLHLAHRHVRPPLLVLLEQLRMELLGNEARLCHVDLSHRVQQRMRMIIADEGELRRRHGQLFRQTIHSVNWH